MTNVILLGPPGSGKGTQSQYLVKHFSFIQLSTGDILRECIETGGEVASNIKNYIDHGKFIPDRLIIDIMLDKLYKLKHSGAHNIIFDGFPRNIHQAKIFDKMLEEFGISLDKVIMLTINAETSVKRIGSRLICSDCKTVHNTSTALRIESCSECGGKNLVMRSDDSNRDVIISRFKTYEDLTAPLFDFYQSRGIAHMIDGTQSAEKIMLLIKSILNLATC